MSHSLPLIASGDAPATEALVIALLGSLLLATAFLSVIGYQVYRVLRARSLRQMDGEGALLSESDEGPGLGSKEEKICRYDSRGCPACLSCAECRRPVCTLYAEGDYCKDCIRAVSPVGGVCQCVPCREAAERFCATCGTPVCDAHTEGDYCGSCVGVLTK
jgi:hypothetical protein